jgi:hypothetical protein
MLVERRVSMMVVLMVEKMVVLWVVMMGYLVLKMVVLRVGS